jgi:molybdopterin synthase catalytic subunit
MISVQTGDFDVGAEYAALRESGSGTGAIATFTGLVRDSGDLSGVTGLFLEHYPGMTEAVIQGLIDEASRRWDVRDARVIHRVGRLALSDQIVFVGVCSAHRGDAFAACSFIMDALKTSAPFWKKEHAKDGSRRNWVEAKHADDAAQDKWK